MILAVVLSLLCAGTVAATPSIQVAAGGVHTVGLKQDGTVVAVG